MPKRRIIRKQPKKNDDDLKKQQQEPESEEDEFAQDEDEEEPSPKDVNPKERKRRKIVSNQVVSMRTIVMFPRANHIPQHFNREEWLKEHEPSLCETSVFESSLHPNNTSELVTIKTSQIFLLRNITRGSKFQYDSTLLHYRDEFPQHMKHYKLIIDKTNEKPRQVKQDRNKIGRELYDLLVEFGFTADARVFNLGARAITPNQWDVGTWNYNMLTEKLHKLSLKVSGSKQDKMLRLLQYMKKMKIRTVNSGITLTRRSSHTSSKLSAVKRDQEENIDKSEEAEEQEEVEQEKEAKEEETEEKIEPPNLFSNFMTNLQTATPQEAKILKECIEYVFDKFYRYRFKNSQLYCQYVMFYLSELSRLENIGDSLPNLIATFELAWNAKDEQEQRNKEEPENFNQKVSRVKLLEYLLENFKLSDAKILSIQNILSSFTKFEKPECEKLYKLMRKEELSEGIIYCCNQHFTFLFVKDVSSNLS